MTKWNKIRVVAVALVLLSIGEAICAEATRLEGCPDPTTMAKALARLEQSDWKTVSLTDVQALWPYPLQGLDCNAKLCTSAWDKARIIKSKCQCCALFYFSESPIDGKPSGDLQSL